MLGNHANVTKRAPSKLYREPKVTLMEREDRQRVQHPTALEIPGVDLLAIRQEPATPPEKSALLLAATDMLKGAAVRPPPARGVNGALRLDAPARPPLQAAAGSPACNRPVGHRERKWTNEEYTLASLLANF